MSITNWARAPVNPVQYVLKINAIHVIRVKIFQIHSQRLAQTPFNKIELLG